MHASEEIQQVPQRQEISSIPTLTHKRQPQPNRTQQAMTQPSLSKNTSAPAAMVQQQAMPQGGPANDAI